MKRIFVLESLILPLPAVALLLWAFQFIPLLAEDALASLVNGKWQTAYRSAFLYYFGGLYALFYLLRMTWSVVRGKAVPLNAGLVLATLIGGASALKLYELTNGITAAIVIGPLVLLGGHALFLNARQAAGSIA